MGGSAGAGAGARPVRSSLHSIAAAVRRMEKAAQTAQQQMQRTEDIVRSVARRSKVHSHMVHLMDKKMHELERKLEQHVEGDDCLASLRSSLGDKSAFAHTVPSFPNYGPESQRVPQNNLHQQQQSPGGRDCQVLSQRQTSCPEVPVSQISLQKQTSCHEGRITQFIENQKCPKQHPVSQLLPQQRRTILQRKFQSYKKVPQRSNFYLDEESTYCSNESNVSQSLLSGTSNSDGELAVVPSNVVLSTRASSHACSKPRSLSCVGTASRPSSLPSVNKPAARSTVFNCTCSCATNCFTDPLIMRQKLSRTNSQDEEMIQPSHTASANHSFGIHLPQKHSSHSPEIYQSESNLVPRDTNFAQPSPLPPSTLFRKSWNSSKTTVRPPALPPATSAASTACLSPSHVSRRCTSPVREQPWAVGKTINEYSNEDIPSPAPLPRRAVAKHRSVSCSAATSSHAAVRSWLSSNDHTQVVEKERVVTRKTIPPLIRARSIPPPVKRNSPTPRSVFCIGSSTSPVSEHPPHPTPIRTNASSPSCMNSCNKSPSSPARVSPFRTNSVSPFASRNDSHNESPSPYKPPNQTNGISHSVSRTETNNKSLPPAPRTTPLGSKSASQSASWTPPRNKSPQNGQSRPESNPASSTPVAYTAAPSVSRPPATRRSVPNSPSSKIAKRSSSATAREACVLRPASCAAPPPLPDAQSDGDGPAQPQRRRRRRSLSTHPTFAIPRTMCCCFSSTAPAPRSRACCGRCLAALGRHLLTLSHEGRIEDVRRLLDTGVDVNFPNTCKWTALHKAAAKAHALTVELLLRRGADVRARTAYGFTALHLAASNDATGRCVSQLIRAGADLDSLSRSGRTPLDCADECGNGAAIRALQAAGASRSSTDGEATATS